MISTLDEIGIIVKRKGHRFFAGIPQFGLFASGLTIAEALDKLELKKASLVASLEEAGELDLLRVALQKFPSQGRPVRADSGGLRTFMVKMAFVLGAIVAGVVISGGILASRVERAASEIKDIKIGGTQFWSGLEKELDRLASPESELPEAKKQKLLADIRVIRTRLRPFFEELGAVSGSTTPPSPKQ